MVPTLANQFQRWFEYEKDAHRRVLASFQTVPADRRESEPFQKAVNLVGHLIAARRVWLHRLGGSVQQPADLFPTGLACESLPGELEAMEQEWSDYYRRLDAQELEREITYQSLDGHGFQSSVVDILTQLYGHSLYHRGQIATLVRAAGGEPAKTDFIFWSREMIAQPAS